MSIFLTNEARKRLLTNLPFSNVFSAEFDSMVRRVIAQTHMKMENLKFGSQSWADQFKNAMNVNGGDIESATFGDYFMHFLTFGFKVSWTMDVRDFRVQHFSIFLQISPFFT